jgi:phenylalanyl-tRNA synthetase beta chain
MKIAYSHLLCNIKESPSINELSNNLFQLGHEHEIDGDIFVMEFTPNRGDCLSVNGLLRDLAAFYTVDVNQKIYEEKLDELSINFENLSKQICPQVSFLKIEVERIPEEYIGSLGNYFSDLDINKNNFYTDVSNYLSYETGQPTHCYDANKMNGRLVFHETDSEEEFKTLLDKKIFLSKKSPVFSLNNNIINLAGVVGGKNTSCSADTKTVIIECAYFQPESIIGKSVKYDINSEASHKFERGVDPQCQERVLRRFIQVISEHTNILNTSIASFINEDYSPRKIPVNVNKINKIIGINLNQAEYINYLSKLGFDFEDGFFKVPSYRSDVRTHNDLAEEVARVIGYNNIKISDLRLPRNKNSNYREFENKLRYFLLDYGFYEVINSPFVDVDSKNSIKVDNPLDSSRKFLRTSLTESLVKNLLYNEKRQQDSVKLFEISDVYLSNNGIHKKRMLSIVASGRVGHNYQDFAKKIDLTYLISLFKKILPNKDLDFNIISRSHLDTKVKNEIINLEIEINNLSDNIINYTEASKPPKNFNQYIPISDFPSSFKDISFSIQDHIKMQKLQNLLLSYRNDIVKDVFIFDYYNDEKNQVIKIGFRFIFQSKKSTLTSEQIDSTYSQIVKESLEIEGVVIPGMT